MYMFLPAPPFLWRIAFVLICICSLFERRYYPLLTIEKVILVFVALNTIYYFVSYLWQEPYSTQIGNTLYSMLSLSYFYYLTRLNLISKNFIHFFTIIFVLSGIYVYYYFEARMFVSYGLGTDAELTNNFSTFFLCILPMIFLSSNKWIKFVTLCICLYFIVISAKRGNIIAAAIPMLLLIPHFIKQSKKLHTKVIAIIALAVVGYNAYHIFEKNDYIAQRFEQLQEGNSSGRDVIYAESWQLWSQSGNLHNFVFGYGTDGTVHNLSMHKRAHNDWLEILVDYGLIGAISYMIIFIVLTTYIWQNRKNKDYLPLLISIAIIWITKSMYSMGFQEEWFAFLLMPLGIAIGNIEKEKKVQHEQTSPSFD